MAKVGKRISAAREGIDRNKLYSLDEAIGLVKERSKTKFDETVEVAINLGVDPRHADQMVRGVCVLPNGTGKNVRVAVFARGESVPSSTHAMISFSCLKKKLRSIHNPNTLGFSPCLHDCIEYWRTPSRISITDGSLRSKREHPINAWWYQVDNPTASSGG